jgi:hypothetical protein
MLNGIRLTSRHYVSFENKHRSSKLVSSDGHNEKAMLTIEIPSQPQEKFSFGSLVRPSMDKERTGDSIEVLRRSQRKDTFSEAVQSNINR